MEEQERGQIERAVAGAGRGEPERTSDDAIVLDVRVQSFRVGSRPSDTGAANKVNKTIQCRADLSAKENVGSWPAHCELPPKRLEQIEHKIHMAECWWMPARGALSPNAIWQRAPERQRLRIWRGTPDLFALVAVLREMANGDFHGRWLALPALWRAAGGKRAEGGKSYNGIR
jgi:hypothetical protein